MNSGWTRRKSRTVPLQFAQIKTVTDKNTPSSLVGEGGVRGNYKAVGPHYTVPLKKHCPGFNSFFRFISVIPNLGNTLLSALLITMSVWAFASQSFADVDAWLPREPYEAPPYVPPPPPKSKVHLVDNKDGTLTETNTNLMWTRKDSYADLGKCLNFFQSAEYVEQLTTGGYDDWRLPSLEELYSIYDDTIENVMGHDHDKENPLRLDKMFADGAAYWYWSSDYQETDLTDCCARAFYYVLGFVNNRRYSTCNNGGVRAVRPLPGKKQGK